MVSPELLEEAIAIVTPLNKLREQNGGDFSFYMNFIKTCPTERKLPKPFLIDYDALQEYPAFYTLPPKLWLGFGINTEDILKYYRDKRSEFPELPPVTRAPPVVELVKLHVQSRLCRMCRHQIGFNLVLSEKYDMVLWLYDSHQKRQLVDYEEQEVIDILKRELRVLEEQEKLTWFYDIEEPRLWTYTRDSCRVNF
ncbi:hypothetical protein FB446DRAFT_718343 [Lentinula raphanica]|nr:hypothetical protein C8R42DRAFT_714884 [Lentinula raphanica]KAJ3777314.1 hypothetical protein FB446DRAFT_718343 [Lentinula raphanica]